jgi:N4-gp56 family major capsid protein
MSLTNFAALTNEELTIWSRDMWKAARNWMFLERFTGGNGAMIQKITELTKNEKGARAVLTLVADLEGDGVAGDRTLEGNEEAMKSYDQVIRIDQLRHANRHEGRMADQKSVVTFRENSRDVLAYWLADRMDQMAFLALGGVAFTQTNKGVARVGSDLANLDYAADVTAASANREVRWAGLTETLQDAVTGSNTTASIVADTATPDTPSWKMLVEAKAYAVDNFIRPIRGEAGTEVYNVFMTPQSIAKLKLDADFLAAWRSAMPRSGKNPLFTGTEVIYVDGLAIYEYRHVYNTKNAASGSKWGSGGTHEGAQVLLCGAQALGFADIGDSYWVEKGYDYDNQQGISVGKICGLKKPVFHSQVTGTSEDFGVLVINTAL